MKKVCDRRQYTGIPIYKYLTPVFLNNNYMFVRYASFNVCTRTPSFRHPTQRMTMNARRSTSNCFIGQKYLCRFVAPQLHSRARKSFIQHSLLGLVEQQSLLKQWFLYIKWKINAISFSQLGRQCLFVPWVTLSLYFSFTDLNILIIFQGLLINYILITNKINIIYLIYIRYI